MSVKKKLVKNGIAASLQKGVRVLDQLLLVPFFITSWGAAYYGEWLTLTIIPTILGFSDLGFGTAAANSFVLKYAANDKQGAANIAKSGFLTISILIIASLLVSVILIATLNYFQLFDKSLIDKDQAIIAVSLLMVARIISFYQQLYEAYYRATRRASLSINLQSGYAALNLTVGMIVLIMGGDIVLFSLTTLIITIGFTILYIIVAKNILPISKEYLGVIYMSDIKLMINKGFGFLMSPVWQAIYFQGTTFVVRIVLGPEAVAIFNTVRTLTRTINQGYSLIISAIIPELQFEIGAGNMEKARKIFRIALSLVVMIALVGSVFLFIFGSWFYELWTQKALILSPMMLNIFIIGIVFNAVWWTSSFIFSVMNRPYDFAWAGVLSALLSVVASYFLALQFGLIGAAIGSLLMDVILFFYVLPKSCKLLDQSLSQLINESIKDFKDIWLLQIKQLLIK